jgi:peptide/nickel transport system permease protein
MPPAEHTGPSQERPVGNEARPAILPVAAVMPGAAVISILLLCLLGPLTGLLPSPIGGAATDANLPLLSVSHLLGTDLNGNDVLSRLVHGGRTSLLIALSVNALGLTLGGVTGALAAQLGGTADALISRLLDAMIAFPSLVLALAIAYVLGSGEGNTILALTILSIPAFARVSRAATLRLRAYPFMLVARLSGTSSARVLLRHVAPNILPQLISFGLLGIGLSMIVEGALSFLGAGVPAPLPSWGNMIFHGEQALALRPSLVMLPAGCLVATVLSFNLLGEALRMHWAKG